MQRIIQINIAGRLIPIEEDAYRLLKDYLSALNRHFERETGKEEIIQDIEYRIAELFSVRLSTGVPCIDNADIQKLIETLGTPHSLGSNNPADNPYLPARYEGKKSHHFKQPYRRLYRNPNDKWLGGVCSGLAGYFDIDPMIVRLSFGVLGFLWLTGVVIYIIAWAIVPEASTPEEFASLQGGTPLNFDTIHRNMTNDLQDLKRRGEQMSRELRDFFSRKL